MSRNGGYKIIDLKNKELSVNVGMVYDGIYDSIEGTRKPILISGLNIEGTEYHDFYSMPIIENTLFKIPVLGVETSQFNIEVTDVDVVTIREF